MRLLGRSLSLVTGDFHLATSSSRDLRPKWVLLVQSRPKWVLLVESSTLLSLVRLGDGPLTRLSVPRPTHLARGVIPPPPCVRDVGSLAIRLKTRSHRLRIANNGTINRTKRIIFVLRCSKRCSCRRCSKMFLQTMFLQTICRRCSWLQTIT